MNTKDGYAKKSLNSNNILLADGSNSVFENNNSTGRNANDITHNSHTYITSNGPTSGIGAASDGALYTLAKDTNHVAQIFLDYIDGRLYTRGKNGNSWGRWYGIAFSGEEFSLRNGKANFDAETLQFNITNGDYIQSRKIFKNCILRMKAPIIVTGLRMQLTNNPGVTNPVGQWRFEDSGKAYVAVNGNTNIDSTEQTYSTSDYFSIELINGTSYFYKNNALIYTGTYTVTDVKAYIYGGGSGDFSLAQVYFGPLPITQTTGSSGNYLPINGGTLTGTLTLPSNQYDDSTTSSTCGALFLSNSNIQGVNAIFFSDEAANGSEGINFYRDATHYDSIHAKSGKLYFTANRALGSAGTAVEVSLSGHGHALGDLSNVTISSPSNGQVLKYNGSAWVNGTDSSGSTTLSGLTDTTISSPSNGQVLKYNGSAWINDTVTAAMSIATSWADASGNTVGASIPTLTHGEYVYTGTGLVKKDPSALYVPGTIGEYICVPVILDKTGKLMVAIPAGFAALCQTDKWDAM